MKVMVPVGLSPPESVAWSEIEPPNVVLAVAEVVSVGRVRTTVVSFVSLQGAETAALFMSPE